MFFSAAVNSGAFDNWRRRYEIQMFFSFSSASPCTCLDILRAQPRSSSLRGGIRWDFYKVMGHGFYSYVMECSFQRSCFCKSVLAALLDILYSCLVFPLHCSPAIGSQRRSVGFQNCCLLKVHTWTTRSFLCGLVGEQGH